MPVPKLQATHLVLTQFRQAHQQYRRLLILKNDVALVQELLTADGEAHSACWHQKTIQKNINEVFVFLILLHFGAHFSIEAFMLFNKQT